MLYTIKNEFLTVQADTFGAEIRSVKSNKGEEYIWQGQKYWTDHAPVLFPTCGNCPNRKYIWQGKEYVLPIHGIAMYREFKLDSCTDTSLTFSLESDEKTLENYPFAFKLLVNYTLQDNNLRLTITPINTGDGFMPYMVGWHPGFNLLGDYAINDYAVDFGSGESLDWYPILPGEPISLNSKPHSLDNGVYRLNEEEIYYNDTMIFENYPKSFSLTDGDGNARISMRVSDNLAFLCIWKADTSDARFVCLEPWSNIFNSDGTTEDFARKKMQKLQSGESASYSYVVTFN